MSFWLSFDGAAPRHSDLLECADCNCQVTTDDERMEFKYAYLCDPCYERRKEDLELEDEMENLLFV